MRQKKEKIDRIQHAFRLKIDNVEMLKGCRWEAGMRSHMTVSLSLLFMKLK